MNKKERFDSLIDRRNVVSRDIKDLKNACVQDWRTQKEKKHFYSGIIEYEKEYNVLEYYIDKLYEELKSEVF